MTVLAKIKFVQGGSTPPAGEALIGSLGVNVVASNGNNTNVEKWEWEWFATPTGSAIARGIIASGLVPTINFTPDTRGTYVLILRVYDRNGFVSQDMRCFAVLETSGRLIPNFGAEGNSLNFGGQPLGWHPYVEAYLKRVDLLGGWTTIRTVDFSAQGSQTLNANQNYVIDGLTFKKENSANDRVAMAVTNGTGLVIKPTTSDYSAVTRSSPLLWLALSQLGIPDLDWGTQLRIWVQMTDSYAIGFETDGRAIVGVDSDSLLWSPGWLETGLNSGGNRQLAAGTRYDSGGGGASFVSAGSMAANAAGVLRVEMGSIGGVVQQVTTVWSKTATDWPAAGTAGFRPAIGKTALQTGVTLLTKIDAGDVGPGAALGIVIGAMAANVNVAYVANIKKIRIDYRN